MDEMRGALSVLLKLKNAIARPPPRPSVASNTQAQAADVPRSAARDGHGSRAGVLPIAPALFPGECMRPC
jgi:hypothetical protein